MGYKLKQELPEIFKNKPEIIAFFEHTKLEFENEDDVKKYIEYTRVTATRIQREIEILTKLPSKEEVVRLLKENPGKFDKLKKQIPDIIIDLKGVNLKSRDLIRIDLREAGLRGANFERANLKNANLWGADLGGVNFERADLEEANLKSTYLGKANLRGVNLRNTDLERTYLEGANLEGANLEGANLENIKGWKEVFSFNNTNITGVKGLSQEQIDFALERGAIKED